MFTHSRDRSFAVKISYLQLTNQMRQHLNLALNRGDLNPAIDSGRLVDWRPSTALSSRLQPDNLCHPGCVV